MFPATKELEHAKFYVEGQRKLFIEKMNFAAQHDMLQLYRESENAAEHLTTVISCLEDTLKSRLPGAPR